MVRNIGRWVVSSRAQETLGKQAKLGKRTRPQLYMTG